MYARSTTVRGNPQAMDDGIAYVRDTVMPAVRQMDGCVGLSMLADRDVRPLHRHDVVGRRRRHARAAPSGVMAMRQRAAEIMGGPADVQEWEIAAHAPAAQRPPRRLRPRDLDRRRPRRASTA